MRFTLWNTSGDPEELLPPEVQEETIYPFTEDDKRAWEPDTPYLEPMILLSALATHTERLRYLAWMLKLPPREPPDRGNDVPDGREPVRRRGEDLTHIAAGRPGYGQRGRLR